MKQDPHSPIPYASRFQSNTDVEAYESAEYAADSYSSCIWRLQQPVLEDVLTAFKKNQARGVRLLDFACGSGRILSTVEQFADYAEGIDISASMAELARKKCQKAVVRVGDILQQPELLAPPYDIITSFRFLLNVEEGIRRKALCRLREVIRSPGGLLIVNVHGNTLSLRHPAIAWNRWRQRRQPGAQGAARMLNEMSLLEAKSLLSESGFELVEVLGFGVMPPTLYRTPARGISLAVDRFFAKHRLCANWSVDLVLICQPTRSN